MSLGSSFAQRTTFFSVIFATASSLRLQHYIARAISDYLTTETGVTIIFESVIVPKWKDSRISFKNVFISRRYFLHSRRPHLHSRRPHLLKGFAYASQGPYLGDRFPIDQSLREHISMDKD
ncbi:mitochondrial distribution and morphology proteins-domain-containing protein [Mycena maculata]|uniref:Mitochondrial distribution and morphology proteins-domain-containing protein n=1 Tax=Mycena maculata TaxID=230809 RepID=A0AAD7KBJ0_9AGAR|nr:mitochondrial distribution and morphology proteins-domain-containing protein [Mycena maculata]